VQKMPEGASPDMLNFQVVDGLLRKRPGYGRYQTGSTFPPNIATGIFSALDAAGTRRLFVVTKLHLYRYNTGTTNWDQMTGPTLTAGDINLVDFAISQNNLVFANGVDNIMAMPLASSTYVVLNASSFPSSYITRWNNRLYAAATVEAAVIQPYRVRWPVSGDHTNWSGVGSGFNDLIDDVQPLRRMRKIGSSLAIYSSMGITLATITGNVNGPASFQQVVFDIGLYSPFSLQGRNITQYFIGTDNFYSFNGLQVTPLLGAVRRYVYSQLSPAQALQNFAFMLADSQEYVACVATSSNTAADTAWVYNWERNIVYPWQFSKSEFTCATLHYLDSGVTIAQLVGTIAQQGWIIGGHTLTANYPVIVLGDNDGHIHQLGTSYLSDDGAAILCRWTSHDYTAGDIDLSFTAHMVTMHSVGITYLDPGTPFTLQFSFSTDLGATWIGPYPLTVGGDGSNILADAQLTQQVTGKRIRFKVENNTTNELPQIAFFYPELEKQEQKIA
jgi:hypothetical protein